MRQRSKRKFVLRIILDRILKRWFHKFGFLTLPEIPERYLLPAGRTDWAALLSGWQPLLPQQSSPWLLTKFGELFFSQSDGKIGMLQVSAFQYHILKDKTDFQEWLA